ncbi:MAG: hypothetical protein JWM68_5082, partial [Verrucomicrobiales bacterium]|nr:hypothetical protein [Verrucomicrobiales bacterium]
MKIIGFGVLLCLVLAGFGCKTHSDAAKQSDKSKPTTSAAEKASVPAVEPIDEKSAEKRVEAFARYATGITYELNEKGDEALEAFYQSALANPGNELLVIELASRFAQKKQTDKSIEILKKSCDRRDATGSVFAMLAQVYLRIGKTNAALDAAQSAIKRSPDILPGYEALADIYSAAGKSQETLEVLDRAAVKIQSVPLMLVNLGDMYASFCKLHPKQKESIAPRAK